MRALLAAALLALALAAPAAAAPIIPLGDTLPLSGGEARAGGSAIAFNPAANEYLVVWAEEDVIRGRRLDAAGRPIGAVIPISGDSQGYGPAVIWDASAARFVVAYSGQLETSESEAFMVTVDAAGAVEGSLVPTTSFGTPGDPNQGVDAIRLARVDGADECPYLLAFIGYGGVSNVYTQLVGDDLTACSGARAFDSPQGPEEHAYYLALVYLPDADQFLVARGTASTTGSLELEAVTRDNLSVDPEPVVVAGQPETENYHPTLLLTGPGDRHVLVWQQSDSTDYWLNAQAYSADREPLTAEPVKLLANRDTSVGEPTAAWHPEVGLGLATWVQPGVEGSVAHAEIARAFDANGNPAGDPFTLQERKSDDILDNGLIAAGANRDWVATWTAGGTFDDFSSTSQIFSRLIGEDLDLDGDGVDTPADCDDANPEIPGAEIANNGVDEDCNGSDLIVGVGSNAPYLEFKFRKGKRFTRVRRLNAVTPTPGELSVSLRCKPRKRCPKRLRAPKTFGVASSGTVKLRPRVGKRLRHRVRLSVRLLQPGNGGRQYRFRTRRNKLPKVTERCLDGAGGVTACA